MKNRLRKSDMSKTINRELNAVLGNETIKTEKAGCWCKKQISAGK